MEGGVLKGKWINKAFHVAILILTVRKTLIYWTVRNYMNCDIVTKTFCSFCIDFMFLCCSPYSSPLWQQHKRRRSCSVQMGIISLKRTFVATNAMQVLYSLIHTKGGQKYQIYRKCFLTNHKRIHYHLTSILDKIFLELHSQTTWQHSLKQLMTYGYNRFQEFTDCINAFSSETSAKF